MSICSAKIELEKVTVWVSTPKIFISLHDDWRIWKLYSPKRFSKLCLKFISCVTLSYFPHLSDFPLSLSLVYHRLTFLLDVQVPTMKFLLAILVFGFFSLYIEEVYSKEKSSKKGKGKKKQYLCPSYVSFLIKIPVYCIMNMLVINWLLC